MPDNETQLSKNQPRTAWNKGKLVGAKPPLRPKHVWSIRTRLMVEGRTRDLALFNLAIDSKLRGCDVVALKVEDVAPAGYTNERATVRQRKTGRPVKFELTEQTRQAIEDYLRTSGKKVGEFLFPSRRHSGRCITTRQYARLVSEWIGNIGLDPTLFGTHSLRRTKATLIYRRHRQPASRAALARKGDILPANNRLKHASLTDFIPALARSCALGGGLSEAAPRFSLCTNLTAPLPAFRRG